MDRGQNHPGSLDMVLQVQIQPTAGLLFCDPFAFPLSVSAHQKYDQCIDSGLHVAINSVEILRTG